MTNDTKRIIKAVLAFVGVGALFAAVSWVSGFNFDQRNEDVGFVFFIASISAIGVARFFLLGD